MIVVENIRPCNRVRLVKKLLTSVGNHIGSVWFIKRSDKKLRKMAYRLRVSSPTYEKKPSGNGVMNRNAEKNLLTVFDTNLVRRDSEGRINGRGGYRSIPLDGVVRVKVGGTIYKLVS